MAKPFADLLRDFSPEDHAKIQEGTQFLLLEHALATYYLIDREMSDAEMAAFDEVRDIALQKMNADEDYQFEAVMSYLKIMGEADLSLSRLQDILNSLNYRLIFVPLFMPSEETLEAIKDLEQNHQLERHESLADLKELLDEQEN